MDRREFLKVVAQGAAVAAASQVMPAGAEMPRRLTLAAVGDCIVTRRISERRDPDFLAAVELLRSSDVAWGNCETVLADSRQLYPAPKRVDPHAIAPPWAADEMKWLGLDFMGTANNHILDFGSEGMFATLENLDRVGIAHAGSGADLDAAAQPGYVDTAVGRLGQVNCASTFPNYFAAGPASPYLRGRPGLNPVRLDEKVQVDRKLFQELKRLEAAFDEFSPFHEFKAEVEKLVGKAPEDETWLGDSRIVPGERADLMSAANPGDLKRVTEAIQVARHNSRLVVASIHAHEARRRLELNDPFLQPFARACIDAGADAFFAAGPHVVRGVEIYKGKPIFYSLSNFVFQYETVQPIPAEAYMGLGLDPATRDPSLFTDKIFYHQHKRFWQSILPRITYEEGKVVAIEVHPLSLGFGQPLYERGLPSLARGEEAQEILEGFATLSKAYGTTVTVRDGVGAVELGKTA